MKKQDLIKLSKDELQTKLMDNQEALVNLRFQKHYNSWNILKK